MSPIFIEEPYCFHPVHLSVTKVCTHNSCYISNGNSSELCMLAYENMLACNLIWTNNKLHIFSSYQFNHILSQKLQLTHGQWMLLIKVLFTITTGGPSWSYGRWIYNYICNQCLSPFKFWVRIPLISMCTWYNFIWLSFQWLVTGQWFSLGTPVSSNKKNFLPRYSEILLKVALNTITLTLIQSV
jgi:hypothetical protein